MLEIIQMEKKKEKVHFIGQMDQNMKDNLTIIQFTDMECKNISFNALLKKIYFNKNSYNWADGRMYIGNKLFT